MKYETRIPIKYVQKYNNRKLTKINQTCTPITIAS